MLVMEKFMEDQALQPALLATNFQYRYYKLWVFWHSLLYTSYISYSKSSIH